MHSFHDVLPHYRPKAAGPLDHGLKPPKLSKRNFSLYKLIISGICYSNGKWTHTVASSKRENKLILLSPDIRKDPSLQNKCPRERELREYLGDKLHRYLNSQWMGQIDLGIQGERQQWRSCQGYLLNPHQTWAFS
jgi:hypothetical protein